MYFYFLLPFFFFHLIGRCLISLVTIVFFDSIILLITPTPLFIHPFRFAFLVLPLSNTEVPLWYSSWLQTILTVLHYAPPQPGAPLVQDAPIFPGVPHFPPRDRAPFGAGLPSFDRDGNEIDIKTLDDRSPKGPMGTKKGPRYILNRIREIGGKV